MPGALKATYHSGTFILQTACDLPEGAEVELFVKPAQVTPPKITDIAATIASQTQSNPTISNH